MKKFTALILMMILTLSLFASYIPRDITWTWSHEDDKVTYYRYQVNDQKEEGWTIVPATETSFTLLDADAFKDYTLFLACSYDGVVWSDSVSMLVEKEIKSDIPETASIPLPFEMEVPSIPEVTISEDTDIVVEKTDGVEATSSSIPSYTEEEKEDGFAFSLLLNGGASFPIKDMDFRQSYGVGLDFSSIGDVSRNLGFGLRLNTVFDMYNSSSDEVLRENLKNLFTFKNAEFFNLENYDLALRASLLGTMDIKAGFFTLTLGLGGGGGLSLTNHDNPSLSAMYPFSIKGGDNLYGFYAEALCGTRFLLGDAFNLGLEASVRLPIKDFNSFKDPYFDISTSLVFGFTF